MTDSKRWLLAIHSGNLVRHQADTILTKVDYRGVTWHETATAAEVDGKRYLSALRDLHETDDSDDWYALCCCPYIEPAPRVEGEASAYCVRL